MEKGQSPECVDGVVGGWVQRRVGGDEEVESRQQEACRGDVDEGEARQIKVEGLLRPL